MATRLSNNDLAVIREIPQLHAVDAATGVPDSVFELGSTQRYTRDGVPIVDWSDGQIDVDALRGLSRCVIVAPAHIVAEIGR